MYGRFIQSAMALGITILASGPLSAQITNGQTQTPPNSPLLAPSPTLTSSSPLDVLPERQLGNVPDDIGAQLQEAEKRVDAIFQAGPLTPLHNFWNAANDQLRDKCRLDLGINYTAIYQRADTTVSGPRDASDGDFDFFGRWHLTGCENHWPGSIVFSSESRHRLSSIPPNSLNTGTVGGTIVGFGIQDFSLTQMYWEQGSYDDGLIYRVGKMDPALIYDGGRYVSSNYAFLSPAFSDTLPMALPGAGLGVAGAVYPTESTYVIGGIHDANGKRTTTGFNTFFGEGEYFSAVEFGWFPHPNQQNEGLYHVTLWHIDSRRNAGRPSDRGVAMTLEQPIGVQSDIVPFLRYAFADRGLNGIRENLSIGVGFENILSQNDDVIGVATSWEEPSDLTLRDQYVVETFYRFYLTPYTHLTPDVQVVIDPANAPTKDAITVFGLRLRTLF